MCGRFTLTTTAEILADLFRLMTVPSLRPRYNIAPTQHVAAIRFDHSAGGRRLDELRWGLVPSWAKDPAIGNRMINARAETLTEKPAFRNAFRKRRCLIPADGFYEWKREGKAKQPYWIHPRDRVLFAFAGLWEVWRGEGDEPLLSCTIITTAANRALEAIHDRMPVILRPDDYDAWLDPELDDPTRLEAMLGPRAEDVLEATLVSSHVNSPRNDDPSCIQPLVATK